MFSAQDRAPWWQGIGGQFATVISDDAVDWKRALTLAGADWQVEKRRLVAVLDSGYSPEASDFYALVRIDTGAVLYVVGGRYHVVQNSDLYEFASNIYDSSDASFVTGWVLHEGRTVGATLNLGKDIIVGGKRNGERIPTYLNVLNRHGGGSLEAHVSPVRVECNNTLNASIKSAQSTWRIHHNVNATKRIAEVRDTLQLSYEYTDALQVEFNALLAEPATARTVDQAIKAVWPEPEKDTKAFPQWQNRRGEIQWVWENSPNLANVKGTKYGVYNAVVERAEWGRLFYGAGGSVAKNETLRTDEVLFGQTKDIGETVFAALSRGPAKARRKAVARG